MAESDDKPKHSVFQRLKAGLARTRDNLNSGLTDLVLSDRPIDNDLLDDLETILLTADVGLDTTRQLIDELQQQVQRHVLRNRTALYQALQERLVTLLRQTEQPIVQPTPGRPLVILMVGINGAGKTTTIGKLAQHYQQAGDKVMLAAGDTFRAAAVEQLQNPSWMAQPRAALCSRLRISYRSRSVISASVRACTICARLHRRHLFRPCSTDDTLSGGQQKLSGHRARGPEPY